LGRLCFYPKYPRLRPRSGHVMMGTRSATSTVGTRTGRGAGTSGEEDGGTRAIAREDERKRDEGRQRRMQILGMTVDPGMKRIVIA
jgi:hypothetical protein